MSGDEVWQDRQVDIDLVYHLYDLRVGEKLIGRFMPVEDTKENQRIRGILSITNLRVLWHASASPRVNLSIGLDCIINISYQHSTSKIEGLVEKVVILTECEEDRKEFSFKCTSRSSRSITSTLKAVQKSYIETKPYRMLRLRNPMTGLSGFQVLPREHICSSISGVCNLSNDQGYLGKMVITNLRVFWFALHTLRHNVSLPYMQINFVSLVDSKFGAALTLETTQVSHSYRFGFRMDPPELMKEAYIEIKKLLQTFRHKPDFGVEVNMTRDAEKEEQEEESGEGEEKGGGGEGRKEKEKDDNVEVENRYDRRDVYSVLCSASRKADGPNSVCYNEELGLMLETLPPGVELEGLCKVFD